MESFFARHGWTNAWRNGIYDFHHYHSNTHEVLGVYDGTASLLLGGNNGRTLAVSQGDVLVLPAGTGHMKISGGAIGVVGAYPGGMNPDLMRGLPGERPAADKRIAAVSLPESDPVFGERKGAALVWAGNSFDRQGAGEDI